MTAKLSDALTQEAGVPAPARRAVFLVEDHPIFRKGLSDLIATAEDLEKCGEASVAAEALAALRRVHADIVVVDISLPGANGIELIKCLRAEHPELPVLVISMHEEATYALRAFRAGACGYLNKTDGEACLIPALREVLNGGVYLSDRLREQVILRAAGREEQTTLFDALTDRELEVVELIGHGLRSVEIADRLHLSLKTIETHRMHAKQKMGYATTEELVSFATAWVTRNGHKAAGAPVESVTI